MRIRFILFPFMNNFAGEQSLTVTSRFSHVHESQKHMHNMLSTETTQLRNDCIKELAIRVLPNSFKSVRKGEMRRVEKNEHSYEHSSKA